MRRLLRRLTVPLIVLILAFASAWFICQVLLGYSTEIATAIAGAVIAVISIPIGMSLSQPEQPGQMPNGVPQVEAAVTEPSTTLDDLLPAYLARIRQRYQRIALDALTPTFDDDVQPVQLAEVFIGQLVQADPPPVELPRELMRLLIDHGVPEEREYPGGITRAMLARVSQTYRQQQPIDVLSLLAGEGAKVVLLGDPGSGKSTLARYIAYTLAGDRVAGPLAPLSGWLPVLIELRAYAQHGGPLLGFLDQLHLLEDLGLPKDLLEAQLRDGLKVVMIFDGMDEIFDPRIRDQVAKQISGLIIRFPQLRVVVTSRPIDFHRTTLEGAGLRRYQLLDLDRHQIGEFVERWYRLTTEARKDDAGKLGKRLLASIDASPPVRELAGNPMLLTILAIINRRRPLPRFRTAVYQHAVDVLVEQWEPSKFLVAPEASRGLPELDAADKLELLCLVARRMQDSPAGLSGNFVSGSSLVTEFAEFLLERRPDDMSLPEARRAAEAMLQVFRSRNFIISRFGGEVYGFVHRSFLEYLAAADIVHRFKDERTLSETELVDGLFGKRWSEPAWHEVLLLTAGMLDSQFVSKIVLKVVALSPHWAASDRVEPHHLLVAIRCIGEARKIGPLTVACRSAIAAVIGMLQTAHVWQALAVKDALHRAIEHSLLPTFGVIASWPGRDKYLDWFMTDARVETNNPATCEIAARLAIVLHPGNHDLLEFLRHQTVHGWTVSQRQSALAALAIGWQDDPDSLPLIRSRVTDDPNLDVRLKAMQTVLSSWPANSATLSLFQKLALHDRHMPIRLAAMQALATHWPTSPETLSILVARAADDDPDIRQAALRALATGWPANTDTLRLLKTRAATDLHENVRRVAVQAIAEGWTRDPETLPLLKDRADNDPHIDVQQLAIEEIGGRWRDDNTCVWLRGWAVDSGDEGIRQTAIAALAEGWRDDNDVFGLLLSIVTQDQSPDVRQAAAQAITRFWHHRTEHLDLFRKWATTNTDHGVRQAGVQAVAEYELDQPGTLGWLCTRATTDAHPYVRLAAVQAVANGWHDDPLTENWLHDLGTTDWSPEVRRTALGAIATSWSDDTDTPPWLRRRATEDTEPDIRRAAIEALALGHHDEPNTRPLLERLVTTDDAYSVRLAATQAIAAYWHDDPATLALLHDRARQDPHENVRRAALLSVAAGWRTDPDSLDLLRTLAATDQNGYVRQAAVQALALIWHRNEETLPLLRSTCVHDEDPVVRLVTMQALADAGYHDANTLPLVRERLTQDPNPAVRLTGLQILAETWHGDPGTLPLLQQRLVEDQSAEVRLTAVQILTDIWYQDPVTAETLRQQAEADPDAEVREEIARTLEASP